MTLQELGRALVESGEIQRQVGREAEMYSVALLSSVTINGTPAARIAGSGTLYQHSGSLYVLTARHVWDEVLRKSDRVGFSLREEHIHEFYIDTKRIVPIGLDWDPHCLEWGPDIVFLRIPNEEAGSLKAFRVFYAETGRMPTQDCFDVWALIGAPEASSLYHADHLSFDINAFIVNQGIPFDHGGFDYLDFRIPVNVLGENMSSFGGLSGCGIWRICAFPADNAHGFESISTLCGVAFYQSEIIDGERSIRCHGPASLSKALSLLPPEQGLG
jgi:hypothetical protein